MKPSILLLGLVMSLAGHARADFACSVAPAVSTNVVEDFFFLTATITSNGVPVPEVDVDLLVISGPNDGESDFSTTDQFGEVLLGYFSSLKTGKDTIRVTSSLGTTCTATAVWATYVNERPIPSCQNVTVSAGLNCSTDVPASAVDDGSFDPDSDTVILALTPAGPFPPGITPVVLTVEDDFGDQETCEATITVTDNTPPVLAMPIQLITNLPVTVTSAVVNFPTPVATDNCSESPASCEPVSGSDFPLGTNLVLCTAVDEAGNTNTAAFPVILREEPSDPHDLTITKLKAPKAVTLSATVTSVTSLATVSIANAGTNTLTISTYDGLVTVVAQSLSGLCPDAVVTLLPGAPNKPLPIILAPKKKLNISFAVKFDCASDPLKGIGHQDYRILATVDSGGDVNLSNDNCPRPPNLLTGDKGCGGKGGTPVYSDVIVKLK